jgi:preprotein translocase subunit SecE
MARLIEKIKTFFADARQEFRHVNWPTRAEAIRLTGVVILISIAVAIFLGAFDYLFSLGLRTFILKV